MIIDKVILHDFGVYAGLQEIDLTPPSPDKPVILFGGLNGAGKTTMLDALQLCLFGPMAKCSSKNTSGYQEYLQNCINRKSAWGQASIGLHFRHVSEGEETRYSLRRTWKTTKSGVKEDFEVYRNDKSVPSIAKNWLQHIEEIMPANIAHLFFFDGEQAENYATSEHACKLIKAAILNLLGLDIVEQLDKDLRVLERKTQLTSLTKEKQVELGVAEQVLTDLQNKMADLKQERAALQAHVIDRTKQRLKQAEESFRKIGGDFYERRSEIEASSQQAQESLADCSQLLVQHAAGFLPLMLVSDILDRLNQRDSQEQLIREAKNSISTIKNHSSSLMDHLKEQGADSKILQSVQKFTSTDLRKRSKTASKTISNEIGFHERQLLHSLKQNKLAQETQVANNLVEKYEKLKTDADNALLEFASIPEEASIKEILAERNQYQTELAEAEKKHDILTEEIERTQREIERKNSELQDKLKAESELRIQHEEKTRILSHSAQARMTLERFRHEVIREHIKIIEALVLESYQSLLHKSCLVSDISINPEDFSVTIFDADRCVIPPERLSAGERQLLAISLLWGMAKASGRPLPTAIDTPLGRLDATHRSHLVERYFPFASHQVLLFSTDQELHSSYLESIKPQIGRKYRLDFDNNTGSTRIVDGYLPS